MKVKPKQTKKHKVSSGWVSLPIGLILLVACIGFAISAYFKMLESNEMSSLSSSRISINTLNQELSSIKQTIISDDSIKNYPEHFTRGFIIVPYKESFGPKIAYVQAFSCLERSSNYTSSEAGSILGKFQDLGYSTGYDDAAISFVKDLNGNKSNNSAKIVLFKDKYEMSIIVGEVNEDLVSTLTKSKRGSRVCISERDIKF